MLKAALIGAGAIAREHLAALAGLPNAEVLAVCDLSPARAEATAERFSVPRWYTDHRVLLADQRPDLVHVTTPPTSHFSITRDCLNAGLNVLCEKPITTEYSEFERLKELAATRGLLLAENQNLRFHSSVLRIQQLVHSGELGEVIDVQVQVLLNVGARGSRYVDANAPHPCLSMRGGAIADFLTHMGYLAYIFAGRPLEIRHTWAKRDRTSLLPADEFRALMKCEKSLASVSFSANAQPNGFWLRVAGTRMHAEANLFEPPRLTLRRLRSGAPPLMSVVDGLSEARAVFRGATAGLWRKLAGTSTYDGLATLMTRTYAALEQGAPRPVPLDEVDDVARMVDAFTDSKLAL
jgi:predicted dehydrogenase